MLPTIILAALLYLAPTAFIIGACNASGRADDIALKGVPAHLRDGRR